MWKEYTSDYNVSDEGQVISNKRRMILKGDTNSKGYHRVYIHGKRLFIHRLVAILFVPNPLNLPQVNHIDHNKRNNRADNLEWCNNQYNTNHSFENGRISGSAKLSKASLISLITDIKSMSVKNVAIKYNLNIQTVYAIRKGRNIKRVSL